jgi:diguanylate cyclase (GGDEF)-like protein
VPPKPAASFALPSFEDFCSELLGLMAQNAPSVVILHQVAQRLQARLGATASAAGLARGCMIETVDCPAVPARHWAALDQALAQWSPGPEEHFGLLSPELMRLLTASAGLRVESAPALAPTYGWKIPIRGLGDAGLGAFFLFLPPASAAASLHQGIRRAQIERKCRLAAMYLERQSLYEQLTRHTHFDSVTGLPNRREFERHMQQLIQNQAAGFAVILVEIDQRHAGGSRSVDLLERALQETASRLRPQCWNGQVLARFSDQEFTILVPHATPAAELEAFGKRLHHVFRDPFPVGDCQQSLQAKLGVAVYPRDGTTVDRLIGNARAAANQAGRQRHHPVAFYDPRLGPALIDGQPIEPIIQDALQRNHFRVFFQPQFNAARALTGLEALIRLDLPGRPLIPPGAFLPSAEESNLIIPIGHWVFTEVCRQAVQWQSAGFHLPRLAVNLSARQLADPGLIDCLLEMVSDAGLNPSGFELELTETTLMTDMGHARRSLRQLREAGFHVSVDDFGSGYSSLSYLHQFPVDRMKIDRSFVQHLGGDQSAERIIEAIIALAGNLGADVLAEGVETEAQLHALLELGCREFQGWLFAPARPAAEIEPFLSPARNSDLVTSS